MILIGQLKKSKDIPDPTSILVPALIPLHDSNLDAAQDLIITDGDKHALEKLKAVPATLQQLYEQYVAWEKHLKPRKSIPSELSDFKNEVEAFYTEGLPTIITDSVALARMGRRVGMDALDICRSAENNVTQEQIKKFFEDTMFNTRLALAQAQVAMFNMRQLRGNLFEVIKTIDTYMTKNPKSIMSYFSSTFSVVTKSLQFLNDNVNAQEALLSSIISWWVRIESKVRDTMQNQPLQLASGEFGASQDTGDNSVLQIDAFTQKIMMQRWLALVDCYTAYIDSMCRLEDWKQKIPSGGGTSIRGWVLTLPVIDTTTSVITTTNIPKLDPTIAARKRSDLLLETVAKLHVHEQTDKWESSSDGNWTTSAAKGSPKLVNVGHTIHEFLELLSQSLDIAQSTTKTAQTRITKVTDGRTILNGQEVASNIIQLREGMLKAITSMMNKRDVSLLPTEIELTQLQSLSSPFWTTSSSKAVITQFRDILNVLSQLAVLLAKWWKEINLYLDCTISLLECSRGVNKQQVLWHWLALKAFHEGYIDAVKDFKKRSMTVFAFGWQEWSRKLESGRSTK